jgi:hypothetical protein
MLESHNELVTLYVNRDDNIKLDCTEHILMCIKKLGYYNLNIPYELDKCIQTKFNEQNIKNISYNDYKKKFKTTTEYYNMITNITIKIERSIKLARYIGTKLNKDFYSDCTLDELYYLGY